MSGEWIKCSERMPKTEKEYLLLATVKIGEKTYADAMVGEFVKDLSKVDSYFFPDEHRPAFIENDSNGYICEIFASYWMELPEMPEGVTPL